MKYTIDSRESKRITCLRAICAVFVIFLHQYAGELGNTDFVASGTIPTNEILQGIQYIFSRIVTFSAVPLFFMLSSVLLYAKEFTWKSNMKKKLKSLILPYFLWISVYILIYFLGQTIPITSRYFANAGRKVSEMTVLDFLGAYTGIAGHGLFVNALWFLRDLIILNLLAVVIKQVIDRFPITCLVLIGMLWNFGSIPNYLILNKQGIVFFALGYYIVKCNLKMKRIDDSSLLRNIILYIISVVCEFCFYKVDSMLIMPAHSFSVILGIILLIRLTGLYIRSEDKNISRLVLIVAKYSFFIYASHDLIQTTLKKILSRVVVQTDFVQMIEYVFVPVCVCLIAIVVASLAEKILPRTFSLMTGSRKMKVSK